MADNDFRKDTDGFEWPKDEEEREVFRKAIADQKRDAKEVLTEYRAKKKGMEVVVDEAVEEATLREKMKGRTKVIDDASGF